MMMIRLSAAHHQQGIAKASEQNLKRTFQYGGRAQYPNTMELKAMLVSSDARLILGLLKVYKNINIKIILIINCSVKE